MRIAILLIVAGLLRRRRSILTVCPRQRIVPALPQRCCAAQHVVVVAAVVSDALSTRVKDYKGRRGSGNGEGNGLFMGLVRGLIRVQYYCIPFLWDELCLFAKRYILAHSDLNYACQSIQLLGLIILSHRCLFISKIALLERAGRWRRSEELCLLASLFFSAVGLSRLLLVALVVGDLYCQ